MQIDSVKTTDSSLLNSSSLLLTISLIANVITILAFLFSLYKYYRLRKATKPDFSYLSIINDEYFLIIITSGFTGSIQHPKFYISKLLLKHFTFKKYFMKSELIEKENLNKIIRVDSTLPRTTFIGEQSFKVFFPEYPKLLKGKYKIYAKTKIGTCSKIYNREYDNLLTY